MIVVTAMPVLAQETEPASTDEAEVAGDEASAADEVTDAEIEELLGLDEEYLDLEDDFDPTEEVRVEQSIPFPTDI
jgi:hypothetical protein